MPARQGRAWTKRCQDLRGAWCHRPWCSQPRRRGRRLHRGYGQGKAKRAGYKPPRPSKARSLEPGCSRGGWITALAINKISISSRLEGSLLTGYLLTQPRRGAQRGLSTAPMLQGRCGRGATPGSTGWEGAGLGGVPGQAGGVTPTCSQPRFSFLFCQAMIYGPFPAAPPPPRPLQKIIIQEQRRKLDLLPRAAPGPAVGAGFVLTSVSSWRRRLISGGIPPSSRCSADSTAQKGPREPGAAGAFRDAPTPPGRVRPGRGAHGARGGFQARCRTRLRRGAGRQRRSPAPPQPLGWRTIEQPLPKCRFMAVPPESRVPAAPQSRGPTPPAPTRSPASRLAAPWAGGSHAHSQTHVGAAGSGASRGLR